MTESPSHVKDLHILAVDDEMDILETIADILDDSRIDTATTYAAASQKLHDNEYDLVILDIMGVDGMTLLDEAVQQGIPAVMLTAHALNPNTLERSFRKGALSYLPKEKLDTLDEFLEDLLETMQKGESPWRMLFERLGEFFARHFGPEWHDDAYWEDVLRKENKEYWAAIYRKLEKTDKSSV